MLMCMCEILKRYTAALNQLSAPIDAVIYNVKTSLNQSFKR